MSEGPEEEEWACGPSPRGPPNPGELYSEGRRLALEELLARGRRAFLAFLRRERLPRFLSERDIRDIVQSARPAGSPGQAQAQAQAQGQGQGWADDSAGSGRDCSSLTYFPERSVEEPPELELGWPAFYRGAYRGPTRVEAHFQPGTGEPAYACREALRRQIRSATQVIALVMDSFTDIDIFRDLQEACRKQGVAVYILLDHSLLCHFLDMCMNLKAYPEQEKLMAVRTITGNTYYTRTGTKIVGKVHEKFMLIDGIRVATGSYSFTWTDGKLNSSNLVILSGQVAEHFDLEFRILYAQSKPISSKLLSSCRISDKFDHLVSKKIPAKELSVGNLFRMHLAKHTSTPNRVDPESKLVSENEEEVKRRDSESSTISEEDFQSSREAELDLREGTDASTQTEPWKKMAEMSSCDVGTQTNVATAPVGTQTSIATRGVGSQATVATRSSSTQTDGDENGHLPSSQGTGSKDGSPASKMSQSTSSSLKSTCSLSSQGSVASSTSSLSSIRNTEFLNPGYPKYLGNNQFELYLRDSFRNVNKERQFHFAAIRFRLNHMLAILSRRTYLAEHYLGCKPGSYMRTPVNSIGNNLLAIRDAALYPSYR
ncbi:protein FAM83D [Ornithorhynchus anatinus]|uniref:Family with sequence similarity 83 member D n=1 Tax=Ornithorhynchus anatinus TaxID=9258 RepID=A0A6I8N8Q0_ORNAN|nr:protein FAM83D [Ornithorhynchus anatinus]